MLICQNIVIISSQQSLEDSPVELVFPLHSGIAGPAAKKLNKVEACFGFLGAFNKLDQPVNMVFVRELRHVIKEYFE